MVIQTFRLSIGDVQLSDYSAWADDASSNKNSASNSDNDPIFSTLAKNVIVGLVWAF
jgi:hypothetical protein